MLELGCDNPGFLWADASIQFLPTSKTSIKKLTSMVYEETLSPVVLLGPQLHSIYAATHPG
jgi:hypothetical protein